MKPMRMGMDRKLTTGCVLLCCLCSADTVLGQGNGDYDGDYDVDATDFAEWAGCMTGIQGAGVSEWSPCGAFDFDSDYDDDLLDFGSFQAAYQKPAAAVCQKPPSPLKRFWIGATKFTSLIGARAKISEPFHEMRLCDENSTTGNQLSSVWISIGWGGNPRRWIQIGYVRGRHGGWVQEGIYAESVADLAKANAVPLDEKHKYYNKCISNPRPLMEIFEVEVPCLPGFDCSLPAAGSAPKTYSVQKEGIALGKVSYHVNQQLMHSWEPQDEGDDLFKDWIGSNVQFKGELFNKQDDLAGQESPEDPVDPMKAYCTFSDIQIRPGDPTVWINQTLAQGDLRFPQAEGYDFSDEWGHWLSGDGSVLKIWDKNLNP